MVNSGEEGMYTASALCKGRMMNSNLENELKQSGLKKTRIRMAVLRLLEENQDPVSAEQIFDGLKSQSVSVNLSTVYRTLESLLGKKMILKRSFSGDSKAVFEYNRTGHKHYLICLGCKKFMPLAHCPLGHYEEALARETNYTIEGHTLDIYGYCPECREKGVLEDHTDDDDKDYSDKLS